MSFKSLSSSPKPSEDYTRFLFSPFTAFLNCFAHTLSAFDPLSPFCLAAYIVPLGHFVEIQLSGDLHGFDDGVDGDDRRMGPRRPVRCLLGALGGMLRHSGWLSFLWNDAYF
jgi:hypothetical protein